MTQRTYYEASGRQSGRGELDPASLRAFISFHDTTRPPLSDALNNANPNTLLSHTTLYGSSSIFHSLYAGEDSEARAEMLRCAHILVEISKELRQHPNRHMLHASLVPMVSQI
ncbi:hypothetical protein DL93DRAFT_164944 [Clavulina sp. PMI_390]|nr:hypothetical protein DL93DRAFT_164944 [Clavulina sp. PMI_390]